MTARRFEGDLKLSGHGIGGWARRTGHGAPLWLELLVDGCVLGIGRADLPEPESCGFWLPLPPAALEGGQVARVRVANTREYIGMALKLGTAAEPAPLQGDVHSDLGLTLSGWVLDTLEPDKRLHITAHVTQDGQDAVAETIAEERRYRPDKGDGHGFTLHLPVALADGEEHLVHLHDAEGRALPGSPARIRVLPQGPAAWLEGQKHLEGPQKALLAGMLRQMEPRVPKAQGLADYAAWKAAFPVPKLAPARKLSVAVLIPGGCGADLAKRLRRQAGVGFRHGDDAKTESALLLQPGERLHPCATAHLAAVMRESGAGLVYADGERRDASGDLLPLFKSCWDREAFLARDYLGPVLVSSAVLDAVRPAPDEPYAALRARLALAAEELGGIRHLPQILSEEAPVDNTEDRRTALRDRLRVCRPGALLEGPDANGLLRTRYPLPPEHAQPRVSVIIPTRDHADLLARCLDSLQDTAYANLEILIVDNGSSEPPALALLKKAARRANTRVLRWPDIFNYAAINNFAAAEASGELLCFLNNDTEARDPQWLAEMATPLLAAGAEGGCVGAKLLWPNGLVQHGGVVVGTHQLAAHVGNQWLADAPGYMDRNSTLRQYSAVTAACLLTPRALFLDLGGFDAMRFPVAFNDVDYCLRLRAAGKKVLWTPFARLLHHESASRGQDLSPMNKARSAHEMRHFRARWGACDDPFYNPNLPLSTVLEPFAGLALPPRARNFR